MELIETTRRRRFKINVLLLIFIASFSFVQAQVKVGDNPSVINANAVLDIEASNKGLLLPRVALTGTANVAPLTAHVAGMAVYNTATAGDVTPGYYFNDGTKWVAIADAADPDMQLGTHNQTLTSNRTVTQGNFDLNFDANTLFIDGSANRVGIGTDSPERELDVFGSMVIGDNSDDNSLLFRRLDGNDAGRIGYATGSNGNFQFNNSSGGGTFTFQTNNPSYTAPEFTILNSGTTITGGGAVINEQSLDSDFRVESDDNVNMLVVNAGTNRVGIGTNNPNADLDVPGGAHLSTTRIQANNIEVAQDASGDRNSLIRFYSDTDGADDAAILRESGVNGNLVIDNEGNGITYLRNRGSGEIRLGTNNSDDLRILSGGQVRLANLPAAADSDLPVQADASGNLKKGYRAGEVIKTTVRTSFSTAVTLGGDQVDISTSYTPVLSNSTILVTYDCDYRMEGYGTDTWYSELFISNLSTRVTLKSQYWLNNGGGGTRSSTLLPITGTRTINSASTFTIRVRLRDDGGSSDDEVTITPNNGIMTITEIAN